RRNTSFRRTSSKGGAESETSLRSAIDRREDACPEASHEQEGRDPGAEAGFAAAHADPPPPAPGAVPRPAGGRRAVVATARADRPRSHRPEPDHGGGPVHLSAARTGSARAELRRRRLWLRSAVDRIIHRRIQVAVSRLLACRGNRRLACPGSRTRAASRQPCGRALVGRGPDEYSGDPRTLPTRPRT